MTKDLKQIQVESISELRDWLEKNHESNESIWVVTWKKNSGHPYISYDEVVDQCLCFGWIDSLPKKLDDQRSMLRLSPRNPKSNWSAVNKKRIDRLIQEDLMSDAGYKMIQIAKENGTWDFLNDVEQLIVPDDLQAALENTPDALKFYERFPPSSKRGILEWIKNAKTIATRAKRIQETAEKAAKNIKANHPAGRDTGPKWKGM